MSGKYFEAKIWMKSKQGENDYSMFINEQPEGGFKWEFLDFEPIDKENYSPLIVHNFTIADLESIQTKLSDLQEKYDRAVEVARFYGNIDHMHEKLISFGGSFNYRGDDWELLGVDDSYKSIIFHGKIAREFLKSIEDEK